MDKVLQLKSAQGFDFKYPIIISEALENKIRYMCSKISTIEWSGVLFYQVKGSFGKKDFKITASDMLLMDVGSSGFTEFIESPEIISYMCQNDLLDYNCGLIHSHNTMSTFFSGTDTSTLQKEGNCRNHFVSLIVNNAGVYSAAMTTKCTVKSKNDIEFDSFNDIPRAIKLTGEEKVIMWNRLKIEGNSYTVLDQRIADVKARQPKTIQGKYYNTSYRKNEGIANYLQESRKYDRYSKIPDTEAKDKWPSHYDENYFDDTPEFPRTKTALDIPKVPVKEVKEVKERDLFDEVEDTELDFDSIKVDQRNIDKLTMQLLTGSILADTEHIRIEEWLPNMKSKFDERFGNSKETSIFELWIESYVDSIVSEEGIVPIDDSTDGNDPSLEMAVIAYYISKTIDSYLENHPEWKNDYIDKIQDCLINYTL